jgi:hypothetical protein
MRFRLVWTSTAKAFTWVKLTSRMIYQEEKEITAAIKGARKIETLR